MLVLPGRSGQDNGVQGPIAKGQGVDPAVRRETLLDYARQGMDLAQSRAAGHAARAAETAIFCFVLLILVRILGAPVTSLGVLSGAVGAGIGFGLQRLAATVVSGAILPIEDRATAGGRVERDRHTARVLFAIRNALDDHGVKIPYPQRAVEIKGGRPT